jgi:hypothetical protein
VALKRASSPLSPLACGLTICARGWLGWRRTAFAAGVRQVLVEAAGQDQKFQPTKGGMHAIALKSSCTGGEWVAWVPLDAADKAWAAIGEAFQTGQLPHCTSAKIGVSEFKGMYVIAVTTADYRNLADVKASYDELEQLGLLAECESGYRMECMQFTGLCRTHDGDSRSQTSNGMELNVYRTTNVSRNRSAPARMICSQMAALCADTMCVGCCLADRLRMTRVSNSCKIFYRRAASTHKARECADLPAAATAGSRGTAGVSMPRRAPRCCRECLLPALSPAVAVRSARSARQRQPIRCRLREVLAMAAV